MLGGTISKLTPNAQHFLSVEVGKKRKKGWLESMEEDFSAHLPSETWSKLDRYLVTKRH